MVAIDIIRSMDDDELLKYYNYCMKQRFFEIRYKNYHSNDSIYLGSKCCYQLHWNNEEFLLSEMWDRYMNSPNFAKQCWWKSKMPWKTKITYISEIKKYEPSTTSFEQEKETIIYKDEIFTLLGSGPKRKAYLSPCKTYVIKVPREPITLGILENKTEAEIYSNNPDSIYAKCELIENDWLKMEYVKPANFKKEDTYPNWTLSIVDHQVGYTLDDRLVAYDYGSEK